MIDYKNPAQLRELADDSQIQQDALALM